MTSTVSGVYHFSVAASTVRLPPATEHLFVSQSAIPSDVSLPTSMVPVAAQPSSSTGHITDPIARPVTTVDSDVLGSFIQNRSTVHPQDRYVSPINASPAHLLTCVVRMLLIPFLLFRISGLSIVAVPSIIVPLTFCRTFLLVGGKSLLPSTNGTWQVKNASFPSRLRLNF